MDVRVHEGGTQWDATMPAIPRVGERIMFPDGDRQMVVAEVLRVIYELTDHAGVADVYELRTAHLDLGPAAPWNPTETVVEHEGLRFKIQTPGID